MSWLFGSYCCAAKDDENETIVNAAVTQDPVFANPIGSEQGSVDGKKRDGAKNFSKMSTNVSHTSRANTEIGVVVNKKALDAVARAAPTSYSEDDLQEPQKFTVEATKQSSQKWGLAVVPAKDGSDFLVITHVNPQGPCAQVASCSHARAIEVAKEMGFSQEGGSSSSTSDPNDDLAVQATSALLQSDECQLQLHDRIMRVNDVVGSAAMKKCLAGCKTRALLVIERLARLQQIQLDQVDDDDDENNSASKQSNVSKKKPSKQTPFGLRTHISNTHDFSIVLLLDIEKNSPVYEYNLACAQEERYGEIIMPGSRVVSVMPVDPQTGEDELTEEVINAEEIVRILRQASSVVAAFERPPPTLEIRADG